MTLYAENIGFNWMSVFAFWGLTVFGNADSVRAADAAAAANEGPRWTLLDFDRDRKIAEVSLEVGPGPLDGHASFVATSKDPDLMRMFERGCKGAMISRFPPTFSAGAGAMPYAFLKIKTNRETFTVSVDTGYFGLGGFPSIGNGFHSWVLAQACDRLQFTETKKHWPPDFINDLSGISGSEKKQDAYDEMVLEHAFHIRLEKNK